MRLAVIGNNDFATGFQLAGIKDVFVVEKKLEEKIDEALQNTEIGVLVMEEEAVAKLSNRYKKMLDKLVTPVVVTISSKGKESDLRAVIKRTVGVDLWK